ncbi:MAG: DNA topoisomerase 3 [Candidatus Anoxychlamydiales bacterium]|nr:DNA topoisomerase 3 [Candidatus Anoxychlamydiales bacterium]
MIVVLAEKPSVGRDLARILGATKRYDGWMEGNGYGVTWAFGHLIELEEPSKYDPSLKKWSLESLPIIPDSFLLKVSSAKGVKQQFNVIKKLFKSAESLICATDAGREGELIFRYILEMCKCTEKPTKRLWISSLTDEAIKEGFSQLKPLSKYDNLANAAKCRAQSDWIVGLNATRGYTAQHSNGQGLLSVGRVQTPILSLIVNRNHEIRNFKPENYWELWTLYRSIKFKHKKNKFKTKEDAQKIQNEVAPNPFIITKIEEKNTSQPPPQLLDLTGLQKSMNRLHNFTANETLKIAQKLYEKKHISYPRTDSCYLSDDLYGQCAKTLENLTIKYPEQIACLNLRTLQKNKRFFNSSKVTDHHAIIPTFQMPGHLDNQEKLVYEAVVLRFIAIFYPKCEKAHTTINGEVKGEIFKAKGTRVIKPGWQALYKNNNEEKKDNEQILPTFKEKEEGPHQPEVKKCSTKPPKSYNEATLLSAMETAGKTVDNEELKEAIKDRGLGTPATRAGIIETLLKREYIYKEKKQLHATSKGEELILLLTPQSTLTSAEMTADWEYRLKQIEKGLLTADEFIANIKEFTKKIIQALKDQTGNNSLNYGNCPLCSKPVIKGKTGYGCSDWRNGCKFRFHANQFGAELKEKEIRFLLFNGKLAYPRKLTDSEGKEIHGYIIMNKTSGELGIQISKAKIAKESIGSCPQCGSSILEKPKSYSCIDCEFVIWKKIAKRDISKTVVNALLSGNKSQVLKGFTSKAGKFFSAALIIKDGKVSFAFLPK